jgi:hypothetical protein
MKSSMEIPLFQWTRVSKLPEWKLIIDVWFGRFKVSIKLNIFFILLIWLVYHLINENILFQILTARKNLNGIEPTMLLQ